MFAKLKSIAKHRQQAGDTIVEVMVVVALLGLAFSISYATATRSLNKTRNAQEHAEALQYINSQVELLRNYSSHGSEIRVTGRDFCMDPGTGRPVKDNDPRFPDVCTLGNDDIYNVTVHFDANGIQDNFQITVKWYGIGDLGPQREHLYYKVHSLS